MSCRQNVVYAPSQWEKTLHCNIATHWLGAYTKWSLVMPFHWLLYLPWRPWCEQTNSQHIIQTYVKVDKFSQLSYHYYGNPFTWIDRLYIEIGFILKKHPKHHILWAKAFFTHIVVHNTCRKIDFLIMDVIWCIYVSWICINDYWLHIYMIICFITVFFGRGIRWMVHSHYKGPVLGKEFQCQSWHERTLLGYSFVVLMRLEHHMLCIPRDYHIHCIGLYFTQVEAMMWKIGCDQ